MTAARAARDGVPGPGQVPAPEPLPAPALDAHCHLDLIEQPAGEVLAAARAAGITRVITVGVDLPSSRWSAEFADDAAGVYAAVAIHPNETAAAAASAAQRDEVLAEIAKLAALPQVRAVGETGLDYYRNHAAPEVQRDWFRAHIEIAKQAGKALMIHDRDAHEDAAVAPPDLILAETDAPFLTPMPHRGKPNTPAMVAHTVRCLAGVRQAGVADMCGLVTATGERMFGPW